LVESILAAVFILFIALFTAQYLKRKHEQTKKILAELDQSREDILQAEKEFKIEHDNNLYFSKRTLHSWKEKWKHLKPHIERFSRMQYNQQLKVAGDTVFQDSILYVHSIFVNGFDLVRERNDAFIKRECETYKRLFDTLEAYPLTMNQCRTIITDEYNNLVVAGAGTGKTSTIIGKAMYILQKGLAKPSEILLLAFADEAKKEMEERISYQLNTRTYLKTKPFTKTFHALGYHIISESKGTRQSVTELKDSLKLQKFIRRITGLDQQHKLDDFAEPYPNVGKNKKFREFLITYFVYHLRPYRSIFEFSSFGEYIDYIKEEQIRSLKGDLVKSYEECEIANFLYINGISYDYERDYEIPTATRERKQYTPDFHLPEYGIYIEHFGINRRGKPAPFVNKEKYLQDMKWKRNTHKQHDTKLVETYSYEKTEGTLLINLKKTLSNHGVKFQRIPDDEIFKELNDLGVVIPFVELQAKFLNLFKSGNFTLNELRKKAKRYADWQRYHAFLDIFDTVYEEYIAHLQRTHRIDFNDMIKQATEHLTKQHFTPNYKYILVDEFQDISQSRYNLLRTMLNKNTSCKLFCVGDDWQSIYRFTGSDLSIMTNFNSSFEFTEQMYLDETFRLNDKICDFSTKFILKNKDQIHKKLSAASTNESPAITIIWSKENNKTRQKNDLLECLHEISSNEENATSVFIIGRYRFLKPKDLPTIRKKFPQLSIKFYTAHKAKGREADYVIISGLRSGRYGFPCRIQDDPVLNLVLAKEDTCPNAEERRVFYVAITRAKKHVYMLADPEYPSTFIQEIRRDNYEYNVTGDTKLSNVSCPKCQTGFVIRREHQGIFYSCNNYPYCDYKTKTCPKCLDGFIYRAQDKKRAYQCSNEKCDFKPLVCPRCKGGYLIIRKKYTKFLGCSNYPDCNYTRPLP